MKKNLSKVAVLLAALMVLSVMPAMAIVRTPIIDWAKFGNDNNHTAYKVDWTNTASQYFKTDKKLTAIGFSLPSYNDNKGTITVRLFKWAGDHATTIKTSAVNTYTFKDWVDNATVEMNVTGVEGGGEYLLHFSGGYNEVGVWVGASEYPDQKTFINGEEIEGAITSYIKYDTSVISPLEGADLEQTSAYRKIPVQEADYLEGATINELDAGDVAAGFTHYVHGGVNTFGTGVGTLFGYANLDFGTDGANGVKVSVLRDASHLQKIQIVLDSPTAEPIGEGTYTSPLIGKEWYDLPIDFAQPVTGVHSVFIILRGDYTPVKVRSVEFRKSAVDDTDIEKRISGFLDDPAPSYTDTYADTWVGTDMLGRHLPSYSQVGNYNPDKQIGLFYWNWHAGGNEPAKKIFNITQTLKEKPYLLLPEYTYSSEWGNINNAVHVYEESIYGYYKLNDRWVIRKQMELLESAGVDSLFFDTTNGATYLSTAYEIMDVMHEMHLEGIDTPKASFMFAFSDMSWNEWDIQNVYESIYKHGLYNDCWYYWDGKPILMAYPDNLEVSTGYDDVDNLYAEMLDFFTFRPCKVGYKTAPWRDDQWTWLEAMPLNEFGTSEKYGCEAMAVGVAQNSSDEKALTAMNDTGVYGRSYTYKDKHTKLTETSKLYGYNFQEQWDYAIEHDPEFIFVTGWNEYRVQRQTIWSGVEYAFADTYTDEYSRDIEPITGDLKDNYYMQMVANIRRFKGVRPTPVASAEMTIKMGGAFSQWNEVGPEFIGIKGGTEARNAEGYHTYKYVNNTGRNDIVLSKVARDTDYLYFYVKTNKNLTSHTDPSWMRLFINTDRTYKTGWEGYDFAVNIENPITKTEATLSYSADGWNWKPVGTIAYRYSGNQMMVRIPRNMIGLEGKTVDIEFKWNDNMQKQGDIMDMYNNGDSAPVGRFAYRYTETTVNDTILADEPVTPEELKLNQHKYSVILAIGNSTAFAGGEKKTLDVVPEIISDKTMIPLRFFSEGFGAEVGWNDKTRTATVTLDGNTASITVGKETMSANGEEKALESPAVIKNGRTLVPMRDIAEALGKQVLWVDGGLIIAGENPETVRSYQWVQDLTKENFGIK